MDKMLCIYCHKPATDTHHIIFRSQGGSDNPENLIPLCRQHHYEIHHGTNTELKKAIMRKTYDQIKDWSKVWRGKIKPKIVIENERK